MYTLMKCLFGIASVLVAADASVIGNPLWNMACRRVPVALSGQLLLFEILFGLLSALAHRTMMQRVYCGELTDGGGRGAGPY